MGQLVSDSGTAVSQANLATDTNLTQALADASGEILSACLRGGRYTETDLTSLTGNSLAYLERLTCDLAVYYLVLRRGLNVEQYPQAQKAVEALELIEEGERVFSVPDVVDAGHAHTYTVSDYTIANNNSIRDYGKYFNIRRTARS